MGKPYEILRMMLCVCGMGVLPGRGYAQSVVTVTVDSDSLYQTIAGFGGKDQEISAATPELCSLLVTDLGVSIVRHQPVLDFEALNDNNDPLTANAAWFNSGTATGRMGILRGMKSAADAHVEPLSLMLGMDSPPPWMKINGRISRDPSVADNDTSTNRLKPSMRDELAEFCSAYLTMVGRQTGVKPVAVAIANKPEMSLDWESCYYPPVDLAITDTVVAARLRRDHPGVLVAAPQVDFVDPAATERYVLAGLSDPALRRGVGIVAPQTYLYGFVREPIPGVPSAQEWKRIAGWARPYGLPVWITDGTPTEVSWRGSIRIGMHILTALRDGRANAWFMYFLDTQTQTAAMKTLMMNGKPQVHFYTCKHFFRFIRPGARMIKTLSADMNVMAIAFRHPVTGTLTVELINSNITGARRVILKRNDRSATTFWRRFVSDSTLRCADMGRTGLADTITLAPLSITTLVDGVWTGDGATGTRRVPGRGSGMKSGAGSARVSVATELDGSIIHKRQAAGITIGDGRVRIAQRHGHTTRGAR